ncbi:hypothetical protein F5Y01DRAFT_277719 [Xylaria sp. FL0043]|nr:hypothetical protein F5Y01DRAFT_277719 [Xylaria sp. FL0043]
MLQITNAFCKLPGDYLQPDYNSIKGFKTLLDERLAPVGRLGEGKGEEAGNLAFFVAQTESRRVRHYTIFLQGH